MHITLLRFVIIRPYHPCYYTVGQNFSLVRAGVSLLDGAVVVGLGVGLVVTGLPGWGAGLLVSTAPSLLCLATRRW